MRPSPLLGITAGRELAMSTSRLGVVGFVLLELPPHVFTLQQNVCLLA